MDVGQALDWLYRRQAIGIKLGLEKMHEMLAELGNPHLAFKSVLVAGTNGKGSVTTMLAGALASGGYKTGRFTSPHLIKFNERVAINGSEISDIDIVRIVKRLQPIVEKLDQSGQPPTFFEITTALAFAHFAEHRVDWAVVEVGMGGRLDATNVLSPELCIITPIGLDHMEYLGADSASIAVEKSGIMKPGISCVTSAKGPALEVIKRVSANVGCPISVVGEDYQFAPELKGMAVSHPTGTAHYDVMAPGPHQLDNATLVIAAADALREQGLELPLSAVQRALATTTIPGRLETIRHEGTEFLLDGAHNVEAAAALRYHLGKLNQSGFQLIVGFNQDKPWSEMLGQWAPLAARVIGVPLRSERSMAPDLMRTNVEGIGIPFEVATDAAEAIDLASQADSELVVVAGSLFLVGEARAILTGESVEEIRGSQ